MGQLVLASALGLGRSERSEFEPWLAGYVLPRTFSVLLVVFPILLHIDRSNGRCCKVI